MGGSQQQPRGGLRAGSSAAGRGMGSGRVSAWRGADAVGAFASTEVGGGRWQVAEQSS